MQFKNFKLSNYLENKCLNILDQYKQQLIQLDILLDQVANQNNVAVFDWQLSYKDKKFYLSNNEHNENCLLSKDINQFLNLDYLKIIVKNAALISRSNRIDGVWAFDVYYNLDHNWIKIKVNSNSRYYENLIFKLKQVDFTTAKKLLNSCIDFVDYLYYRDWSIHISKGRGPEQKSHILALLKKCQFLTTFPPLANFLT